MDKLFEIEDKTGRKIYLTRERWKHLVIEHPLLSGKIEDIKETIIQPLIIKQSKYDKEVRFYYRHYKDKKIYLLVAVKYLNGKGFIITSFYVKNLRK